MKHSHLFTTGAALLLIGGIVANPSSPTWITGYADVIDGDTITIKGERIRLAGIDAPELSQTCEMQDGTLWHCGTAAKTSLSYLTSRLQVTCTWSSTDHYGRALATCKTYDGTNLNQHMVRLGLAVAYRSYSSEYLPDEEVARRERRGIWATNFIEPEQSRHRNTP